MDSETISVPELLSLACAFGALFTVLGVMTLWTRRRLQDTPHSKVRSLAHGAAEVQGHASRRATLLSPLTGTPCVFYDYHLEHKPVGEEWQMLVSGDSGAYPIRLVGETGHLLIDAHESLGVGGIEWMQESDPVVGPWLEAFFRARDLPVPRRFRFAEKVVPPGSPLLVSGSVREAPATHRRRARLLGAAVRLERQSRDAVSPAPRPARMDRRQERRRHRAISARVREAKREWRAAHPGARLSEQELAAIRARAAQEIGSAGEGEQEARESVLRRLRTASGTTAMDEEGRRIPKEWLGLVCQLLPDSASEPEIEPTALAIGADSLRRHPLVIHAQTERKAAGELARGSWSFILGGVATMLLSFACLLVFHPSQMIVLYRVVGGLLLFTVPLIVGLRWLIVTGTFRRFVRGGTQIS